MTQLQWTLLVDDLDDFGSSLLSATMGFLKVNVFPTTEPFCDWSEADQMRAAIDAIMSLGNDGLVEFWKLPHIPGKTVWERGEILEWIEGHRYPLSLVKAVLARLTPVWWAGDRPEDVDWGRTTKGQDQYEEWLRNPPPGALY